MQLKILRLHYKNIRDFRDLDLDFTRPKDDLVPHHVSLVQMPNGTGKTTTINLLRRVLAGGSFTSEEVRGFAPTKWSAKTGSFGIDLAVDTRPFNLRVEFDFAAGEALYFNSKPAMKSGGQDRGHYLPPEIEPLIHHNDRFVSLFVFDGEQAKKLLNKEETAADQAIRSIFFLNRLAIEKETIEQIRERRRAKSKGVSQATTQQGLKNLQSQLRNLKDTLREHREHEKNLRGDAKRIEGAIKAKEAERDTLLSSHEDITEKNAILRSEIDQAEKNLVERTRMALAHIRKPSNFSPSMRDDIVSLGNQMAILKLPKATSAEFFNEFSERKVCICGRPIGAHEKDAIQNNAHEFLSEENIGILNAIKSHVRGLPAYEGVNTYLDQIAALKQKRDIARQKRDQLTAKLDPAAATRANALREEISTLKAELKEKTDELNYLTTASKDLGLTTKENIPLCQAKILEFETRIAEVTGTVRFERKAAIVESIIDQTIEDSMRLLKDRIVEKTNDRIEKFLQHKEVSIAGIQDSIQFAKKGGVSEGQTLSVAYAFLSTLFENSPCQLPFVVDSPAVSIDLAVRREVSETVPKMFKQMIVFIISSERPGFMVGMDKQKEVQVYTVYRDTKPGSAAMMVSTERKFFDEFQSEDDRRAGVR